MGIEDNSACCKNCVYSMKACNKECVACKLLNFPSQMTGHGMIKLVDIVGEIFGGWIDGGFSLINGYVQRPESCCNKFKRREE